MIREEFKMQCSLDGIRRLGPILIAAGLLFVTCRGHDVNTTMASSIGNATLKINPVGMIGVPEGTLQEENRGMVILTSRVKNSSKNTTEVERAPQQARKRGGNAGNIKNTNSTTTPKQNIRHNKQKRGRGKGRGRGRGKGKGKGRHRHEKSKTKDPSSQHSHIRRNLEKQVLVQNRTLELLGGGGARILWATGAVNASSDVQAKEKSNSSIVPVNLVSSKKTSATQGILVGLLIKNNTSLNLSAEGSERTPNSKLGVISTTSQSRNVDVMSQNHKNNVSHFNSRTGGEEITVTDYQYDYDAIETPGVVEPSFWFSPGDSRREDGVRNNGRVVQSGGVSSEGGGIEPGPLQAALGTTLARVLGVLTDHGGGINVSNKEEEEEDKDPCERWMRCKDKLEKAFLGPLGTLPSCPCHYPSAIFYDDKIWDQSRGKYFRWRDVSGEAERLDVYKPGAAYCIRSLLAQGSTSLAAQHCCYDRFRRLLTRGSGAGTPDFVSPEVSASLHEKVDILPWKLCKGDFTRYNSVRPPNNDNSCVENPPNEEYQRQVQMTQYF